MNEERCRSCKGIILIYDDYWEYPKYPQRDCKVCNGTGINKKSKEIRNEDRI